MIAALLEAYSRIITSWNVQTLDIEPNRYRLVLEIEFVSGLRLFVKDYLFEDGRRKYSYHCQDSARNLVFRYDNAPHWVDIATFPHHKHLPDSVIASSPMTLEKVCAEIAALVQTA
jgi:Family of unknown function (DUF6516)